MADADDVARVGPDAYLHGANLRRANLRGADLRWVYTNDATLLPRGPGWRVVMDGDA